MRFNRTLIAAAVLGAGAITAAGVGAAHAQSGSGVVRVASQTVALPSSASASGAGAVSRGCLPDFSPIPDGWSTEKGGLDIGELTKVTSSGGVVRIRIDRVSFFTGAEARALNNGKTPPDNYLLTNVSHRQRTFSVDPKSSIFAESDLLTDPGQAGQGRQKLTLKQFLANANRPQTRQDRPLVWLRHTHGMSGTVTAILEQYTP